MNPPTDPADLTQPLEHWPRRLARRLDVDRAVVYAASGRIWQLLAGPITVLLIAYFFTPTVQNFFYAFGSILAIQNFFELGLAGVLVSMIGHEHAHTDASDDAVRRRAQGRLKAIVQWSDQWFTGCAILFAIAALAAGWWVFTNRQANIAWQLPWLCLVPLSAASFWLLPRIAYLEGTGRVTDVHRWRFGQIVVGNLAVWSTMIMGLDLWVAVASAFVQFAAQFALVFWRFPRHRERLAESLDKSYRWTKEIAPLQWRVAVQGLAAYVGTGFFTLILFAYQDDASAGQMGLTWNVLFAIQSVALAWLQTRYPALAQLSSAGRHQEFVNVWWRSTLISAAALLGMCVALVGLLFALQHLWPRVATKLLEPTNVAFLCVGIIAVHFVLAQLFYVRAQRRDPLVWASTFGSLTMAAAAWYAGAQYGAFGIAVSYCLVAVCVLLPLQSLVWIKSLTLHAKQ